jgi:hypothetical protein
VGEVSIDLGRNAKRVVLTKRGRTSVPSGEIWLLGVDKWLRLNRGIIGVLEWQ